MNLKALVPTLRVGTEAPTLCVVCAFLTLGTADDAKRRYWRYDAERRNENALLKNQNHKSEITILPHVFQADF